MNIFNPPYTRPLSTDYKKEYKSMLLRLSMPILIYLLRRSSVMVKDPWYPRGGYRRYCKEAGIAKSEFIDLMLHLQIYGFLRIIDETK